MSSPHKFLKMLFRYMVKFFFSAKYKFLHENCVFFCIFGKIFFLMPPYDKKHAYTRDDQKILSHFSRTWLVALNTTKFETRWKSGSSSVAVVHAKNEGDPVVCWWYYCALHKHWWKSTIQKMSDFWKNKGMRLNVVENLIRNVGIALASIRRCMCIKINVQQLV